MQRNKELSIFWLFRYLRPVKGRLVFLLGMLLSSTALQLINPHKP